MREPVYYKPELRHRLHHTTHRALAAFTGTLAYILFLWVLTITQPHWDT